jgi:hypothetical protein
VLARSCSGCGRGTGDNPFQPIFIEAEPATINAVRLPRAAMIRTILPFMRSPVSFLGSPWPLTTRWNRIRSAGVIKQNGQKERVAGVPPRVPGFIRELWLSSKGPSNRAACDRTGTPMTLPNRTVYITGRGSVHQGHLVFPDTALTP